MAGEIFRALRIYDQCVDYVKRNEVCAVRKSWDRRKLLQEESCVYTRGTCSVQGDFCRVRVDQTLAFNESIIKCTIRVTTIFQERFYLGFSVLYALNCSTKLYVLGYILTLFNYRLYKTEEG